MLAAQSRVHSCYGNSRSHATHLRALRRMAGAGTGLWAEPRRGGARQIERALASAQGRHRDAVPMAGLDKRRQMGTMWATRGDPPPGATG